MILEKGTREEGVNEVESSITDAYVTPSTDFNRGMLKQLTEDACKKLKNKGVRIYVIKYKVQQKWEALTRSGTTAVSHDYTAIDNCAMSSGGEVYNVSSENDLKSTLNTIAQKTKTFAGRVGAKNVK